MPAAYKLVVQYRSRFVSPPQQNHWCYVATNSDLLILISLQPGILDFLYFKLWSLHAQMLKICVYTIRLQIYRDQKTMFSILVFLSNTFNSPCVRKHIHSRNFKNKFPNILIGTMVTILLG